MSRIITSILIGSALFLAMLRADDLTATYRWQQVRIGGGGYVTGIVVNPRDEEATFCRTDTAGAFRWNGARREWECITRTDNLPGYTWTGEFGFQYPGCDAIAVDPSDAATLYLAMGFKDNRILRSTDRGETWSDAGLAVKADPNDEDKGQSIGFRNTGERLHVDPRNRAVLYYGTHSTGLQRTLDGRTWQAVRGIGAKQRVVNVRLQSQGGEHAGRTKTVFAVVLGAGLFRSDDGGDTFAPAPNGPPLREQITDMECDEAGHLWLTSTKHEDLGSAGAVYRYDIAAQQLTTLYPQGGQWKNEAYWQVTFQPGKSDVVHVFDGGGRMWRSADGGATWSPRLEAKRQSPDIPWLHATGEDWFSFAPVVWKGGELWCGQGIGVWRTRDLSDDDGVTWTAESRGIENLVAYNVAAPGNGRVFFAVGDRGLMFSDDPARYVARQAVPLFTHCQDVGWCGTEPRFVAAASRSILGNSTDNTRFTRDAGDSWSAPGSIPDGARHGYLAVSAQDAANWVWVAGTPDKARVFHTRDSGATWQPASIAAHQFSYGVFDHGHPLAADAVVSGKFYLYERTSGPGNSPTRLWISEDAGKSWQAHATAQLPYHSAAHLKAVPGRANEVWFCGNDVFRSTDGGKQFAKVEGFSAALALGFGKAAPGSDHPAIYVVAKRENHEGVWRSTDAGATWQQISSFPGGVRDKPTCASGDMDVFGRVYVGFNGSGYVFGEPIQSPK